jgi:benzoylformate decarboxylase
MSSLRGNEAFLRALLDEGVRYIFGNPGSTEVQWLELLPEYPELRYMLALHENIAVGMADGYALASGELGVASVHASPGTAHTLGNLYNAWVAGSPLVLLIGQIDSRLLLREPFLASDLAQLVRPYVKWSWEVGHAEEIPLGVHRACKLATDTPTGPTALVVPHQLYDETLNLPYRPPTRANVARRVGPDPAIIQRAAEALLNAERPAILCGPGVHRSEAIGELAELAELLAAPVYDDIRYPATFPTRHPLYHGLFQVDVAAGADLLVVIGQKVFLERRYEQISAWPPELRLIQIDSNASELAKNLPVEAGILGDPKLCLAALLQALQEQMTPELAEKWTRRRRELDAARQAQDARAQATLEQRWDRVPISPERLAAELRRIVPQDGNLVVEAVSHHAILRRYFSLPEPGQYFASVGASLGWALPAALGVKLARPEQAVVCVIGDGSFLYYPQTLWTAQRYHLPVIVVVCNNRSYLNDKMWLRRRGGPAAQQDDYSTVDITQPDVDFVRYAEAVGARGQRIEQPAALGHALTEALNSGETWVLDVAIDPEAAGHIV